MQTGRYPAQAEQLEAAVRLGLATDPVRRPATPGELVESLRTGWGAALPTGVMTFCLSDIEGSTELLERLGDRYVEALGEHRRLLRAAFAEFDGHELGTEGVRVQPAGDVDTEVVGDSELVGLALRPLVENGP